MASTETDPDEDQSFTKTVTDTLLLPVRVATSPVLLRTYLRTIFLFLASCIFFGFAVVAYSSLYYSYIPVRGISVPVYLQYDHGAPPSLASCVASAAGEGDTIPGGRWTKWPYGIANVPGLIDRQKYDFVVEMDVPRSDNNLQIGNWMIVLEMRGPTTPGSGGMLGLLGWEEEWDVQDHSMGVGPASTATGRDTTAPKFSSRKAVVLARSRRPAILTYRSRIVEAAHRLLRLPFYLFGWHTESEHVEVSMMESVVFEQGDRNIPTSLRLEIRSKQPLEVYRVKVHISARLEGLRWLMYKYWITSAVVGIGLFWGVEMGVLIFTWALFTLLFSRSSTTTPASPEPQKQIKSEPDDQPANLNPGPTDKEPRDPLSDTSHVFPTLPSQQPLSYTSIREEAQTLDMGDVPIKEEAEAHDEDDDSLLEEMLPLRKKQAGFEDSGLGTSLESSVDRGLSRRRSVKGKGMEDERANG